IGIVIARPVAAGVLEVPPSEGLLNDLGAGARAGRGGFGELLFIKEIGGDRGVAQEGGSGFRVPIEDRVGEQLIIVIDGTEVMAPCIAVALRIERLGVLGGDDALGGV